MARIITDKQTASVCGLLCKACGVYIATQENNAESLRRISERLQVPVEQIRCNGCRSDVLSAHCQTCFFRECADKKGIEFCSECADFPCAQLKDFQSKLPHRVELFQSLNRIKEVGWGNWYAEMVERHSCTKCNHLSGWYDFACSKCGNSPSSRFVADNFDTLIKFKR